MKKINAGNLFAGMRSSSVIAGLFIVLIVSIVLLFANFAYLNTQSNHDKQYIGHAGELRVLSQRIAKNATEAAAGKGEAFKLLKDARNDFEKRWNILVNGDESTSLPPSPEAVKPQMDVVQQDWDGLRKNADSILASEQTVLSLHQVASTLAETIPQLQVEYEEVVDILLENGAPADQVAVAQRQSLLAERILGSVNKVLAGDENSVQAADSFGRDASLFGRVLKGMQEGNAAMSISKVTNAEAVDRLNEIAELFEFVSGSVDEILETSPDLFQVREAANNIFSVSQTLLDKASQLADGFENLAGGRSINLKAGEKMVIEAASELTVKAGGSVSGIDGSGIASSGAMARINAGGAPGSGSGIAIKMPRVPGMADQDSSGAPPEAVAANLPPRQPVCEECLLQAKKRGQALAER
ncbi:type IV pili methyl-accepting chemotaxis transducer N-terminal domain-containing protein [Pseudomonas aeruginosa]